MSANGDRTIDWRDVQFDPVNDPTFNRPRDVSRGVHTPVHGAGDDVPAVVSGNQEVRPENREERAKNNNHPDDAAVPIIRTNRRPNGRQTKIQAEGRAILVNRGLEPEFASAVIDIIRKRARTEPVTAKYYVSSFDNESLNDWKAWVKIGVVHDAVETAAREGRTAPEVLRERFPEGVPPSATNELGEKATDL